MDANPKCTCRADRPTEICQHCAYEEHMRRAESEERLQKKMRSKPGERSNNPFAGEE